MVVWNSQLFLSGIKILFHFNYSAFFFRIPLTFSGQENPQQVHCEWIPESEQIEILLESSEVEWVLFNIDQQGSTFLTFKKCHTIDMPYLFCNFVHFRILSSQLR